MFLFSLIFYSNFILYKKFYMYKCLKKMIGQNFYENKLFWFCNIRKWLKKTTVINFRDVKIKIRQFFINIIYTFQFYSKYFKSNLLIKINKSVWLWFWTFFKNSEKDKEGLNLIFALYVKGWPRTTRKEKKLKYTKLNKHTF